MSDALKTLGINSVLLRRAKRCRNQPLQNDGLSPDDVERGALRVRGTMLSGLKCTVVIKRCFMRRTLSILTTFCYKQLNLFQKNPDDASDVPTSVSLHLVDEYQDTNNRSIRIVKCLSANHNLV